MSDTATLARDGVTPRARNAEATRAAILEAARALFARVGYDLTSLRDIAIEANADAALVKRYFGGKEALFKAALEASFQPDSLKGRDRATFAREVGDRLRLMHEMFLARADWVLSGGITGWGDEIIPRFDLVVFLTTPHDLRMQRLHAREAVRFGADAVAPGGWRNEETEAFIEWASHYEDGTRAGRSLARHQAWIERLPCPVLRLDGSRPLSELVAEVCAALD